MGLGGWRFFLAFLVTVSHLWADMLHGPAAYAVWGFFVLSGYLMVLVLTTKYGTTVEGIRAYAFNRFLRIYPPYIVAVALALMTIALLPGLGVHLHRLDGNMGYPANLSGWAATLGMVFFLPHNPVPIPIAWALYVEVAAYALMPLLAKSRGAAILAFIMALVANMEMGFSMESNHGRYQGLSTSMAAFAAGALVCHFRARLRALEAPRLSVLLWCAHGVVWLFFPHWPWTYGLLFSVLLSAWVVLSLAPLQGGGVNRWLGDLSYPVYLLHMIAGAWMLVPFGYDRRFSFFLTSFAVTLALAWLFVVLIDRRSRLAKRLPLVGLRTDDRSSHAASPLER